MKKVKIILVGERYEFGDSFASSLVDSITDWEELTDEDYAFLKSHMYKIKADYYHSELVPVLIEYDAKPVAQRITDLKAYLDEQRRVKEEEERKKQEKAMERKLARLAKTKAEELELLEKLKNKYNV